MPQYIVISGVLAIGLAAVVGLIVIAVTNPAQAGVIVAALAAFLTAIASAGAAIVSHTVTQSFETQRLAAGTSNGSAPHAS